MTVYAEKSTDELKQMLTHFRDEIRHKGIWISVYERGQAERIVNELDRRGVKA